MSNPIKIVELVSRLQFKIIQICIKKFGKIPSISELLESNALIAKKVLDQFAKDVEILEILKELERMIKSKNFKNVTEKNYLQYLKMPTLKSILKSLKEFKTQNTGFNTSEKTKKNSIEMHYAWRKNGDLIILTIYNPAGVQIEKIVLNNQTVEVWDKTTKILSIDLKSQINNKIASIVHIGDLLVPNVEVHIRY